MGGQKAAILAQVGQIYFGAVGQFYIGANTDPTGRDIEGFIRRPRPTVGQLKQEQRSRWLGR